MIRTPRTLKRVARHILPALLILLSATSPPGPTLADTNTTQPQPEPETATINIDVTHSLRPVNKLIFGEYIFANSWGNGILDKTFEFNPVALEMIRELRPTILRFAVQPIWEDGIGDPLNRREARCGREAWHTHHYGIDEHMALARAIGAEAMVVVGYPDALANSTDPKSCVVASRHSNLSQMVKRAAAWVAYANGDPGDLTVIGVDDHGYDWKTVGYWAQKRVENGSPEPYNIKYWEIGNELFYHDAKIPPEQYGEAYIAFRHAMKLVDPDIITGATVLPGEWGNENWNRALLSVIGHEVDALVAHPYYPIKRYHASLQPVTMAATQQAEQELTDLLRLADELSGRGDEIGLIISEMGVNFDFDYEITMPRPLTMLLGSLLHADMLGMMVQKSDDLNIMVGIQHWLHGAVPTCDIYFDWKTGERYRRPDYYALQMWTNHFGDILVPSSATCDTFDVPTRQGNVGPQFDIPYLAAHASLSGDKLYILVINRKLDGDIPATIRIHGYFPNKNASVYTLTGPDVEATNEDGDHNTVTIQRSDIFNASHDFTYTFPSHSVTTIELTMSRDRVYLPLVPITPSVTPHTVPTKDPTLPPSTPTPSGLNVEATE
jgi:alpha-L-arabinofuranosidase